MNTKPAVALTALNIAAVAASAAMLVAAKFERTETARECEAAEARLAEAAKDANRAETSMLGIYQMLQAIESRVFNANLEWQKREDERQMMELDKKMNDELIKQANAMLDEIGNGDGARGKTQIRRGGGRRGNAEKGKSAEAAK